MRLEFRNCEDKIAVAMAQRISSPAASNKPKLLDQLPACASKALRICDYARTGTLAVRSSLPQLTQAPLIARRIAFQMQ